MTQKGENVLLLRVQLNEQLARAVPIHEGGNETKRNYVETVLNYSDSGEKTNSVYIILDG